jgi:small-conductance mechanosensitive channel/CRP-like cAMP-binding protein
MTIPKIIKGVTICAALFYASPALAQEPDSILLTWRNWQLSVAVLMIFLFAAFVINWLNPAKRNKLRRTLFLYGMHLFCLLLMSLFKLGDLPDWSKRALVVSHLFAGFSVIHSLALLIFDSILVKINVVLTAIAVELLIAAGYIVAFVFVLAEVGVDATGLLTASTVVTAVVGLSLQQTLGNILGGVALQLDNSISVGDWIQLVPGGPRMRIAQIRWRHTVAETAGMDTIILPNATLLSSQFTVLAKYSGKPANRVSLVEFSVPLSYSPDFVCALVQEAVRESPIVNVSHLPEAPLCVCMDFTRLGFRGLAIYGVAFCVENIAGELTAGSRVRRRVYCALKRNGIPVGEQLAPSERDLQEQKSIKRQALGAVDIFSSLSDEERDKLAEHLIYAPFSQGEAMTRQGTQPKSLGILWEGTAEVRMERDGVEKVITTLQAPTFFGEMALLTGAKRSASVVASSNVECYRLEKDAFHKVLQERPQIAEELSKAIAHRKQILAAATQDLDDEQPEQPEEELAKQILNSIQKFFGLSF